MQDMPQSELDAIQAERAKFFTPRWFGDLFAGRLSPGDTFWVGNYGPAMVVVPALVLIALFTAMASPGHLGPLFGGTAILAGLYRIAVLIGLFRSVARTPGPKGWRIFGLLWTVFEAAILIWLGLRLIGG
ncbi:hypothetical protein BMG00_10955 [Thioclava marina]|jgi:hypothetical protein|uniref:MAPEG family protein n=1 Tax=Thioclava marina TaxID=1915077 RepID=A0ABX3MJ85_9RHOB|nr:MULTISPECIES: hypothetical protein [Thioclava]MBD3804446.1 hypothetical protein [Thioclava sp.]OOY11620.1 hypothetical protein BMG00_10955 [Thioclava marina]